MKTIEPDGDVGQAVVTRNLGKTFGDVIAVHDLNLEIERGAMYGLIGPNGSGKTTTIRILIGLLGGYNGAAWLLGERVPVRLNLPRIGYMPQEMAIYTDLTVHENIDLFGEMYSMSEDERAERENTLLDMIDLRERRDSLVSTLSGGMRHRVSLACALIHDPELVFLDEPTVGVDPELRKGFWDYFAGLKAEGKTVVLTTHYMDEAVRCDTVGMMRLGRMIAEGAPMDLIDSTESATLEDAFIVKAREESP